MVYKRAFRIKILPLYPSQSFLKPKILDNSINMINVDVSKIFHIFLLFCLEYPPSLTLEDLGKEYLL